MKQKNCKYCEKPFMPFSSFQKCCSPKCANGLEKQKKEGKKNKQTTGNGGIKHRLDEIFSLYIRARDNYTCCICGVTGETNPIDNGHYIPRGLLALRWDETNCHAQCKTCNGKHNTDREPYRKFIVAKYGEGKLLEFSEKSNVTSKLPRYWYEEMIQKYKEKLSSMK